MLIAPICTLAVVALLFLTHGFYYRIPAWKGAELVFAHRPPSAENSKIFYNAAVFSVPQKKPGYIGLYFEIHVAGIFLRARGVFGLFHKNLFIPWSNFDKWKSERVKGVPVIFLGSERLVCMVSVSPGKYLELSFPQSESLQKMLSEKVGRGGRATNPD